jgi:tetratricopeptide (TPR) repeat protein
VNVNNTTNNIANVSGNRNWNGGGWNGGGNGNNWQGSHNYWNNNYGNWHPGNWSNWNYHPAAWYGAGAATGWLADNYAYSNPFYVAPTAVAYDTGVPASVNYNSSYYDYAQPIEQPPQQVSVGYGDTYAPGYDSGAAAYPQNTYADTTAGQQVAPAQADTSQAGVSDTSQAAAPVDSAPAGDAPPEAFQYFEKARTAFKANDYSKALAEVNHAIKLLSSDARMHEFRSLVLFAQGKYHEAAEGIYAVLSMGPGWTWDTLMSLYANENTYTKQLRGLEAYCRKNPNASDGRFLLGYHYIVMNHVPEGVNQLQHFAALVPKDRLAPQLIKAFSAPSPTQGTAELPAQSSKGEPQP